MLWWLLHARMTFATQSLCNSNIRVEYSYCVVECIISLFVLLIFIFSNNWQTPAKHVFVYLHDNERRNRNRCQLDRSKAERAAGIPLKNWKLSESSIYKTPKLTWAHSVALFTRQIFGMALKIQKIRKILLKILRMRHVSFDKSRQELYLWKKKIPETFPRNCLNPH